MPSRYGRTALPGVRPDMKRGYPRRADAEDPPLVWRLFPAALVEGGVDGVEIFGVEIVLGDAEGIEETVRVKYFDIYISNAESIKL